MYVVCFDAVAFSSKSTKNPKDIDQPLVFSYSTIYIKKKSN